MQENENLNWLDWNGRQLREGSRVQDDAWHISLGEQGVVTRLYYETGSMAGAQPLVTVKFDAGYSFTRHPGNLLLLD